MSKFAIFSGPGGYVAGGLVALGVVLAGVAIWGQLERDSITGTPAGMAPSDTATATTPEQTQTETAPQATVPQPAAAPPATAEDQTPDAATTPRQPSFALVRVEPDGFTQVAGSAEPGGMVELLLDEAVVGSAQAGADGSFAALLDLPPSDAPRMMSLRMSVAGQEIRSAQNVIIAPSPQTVAQAEPETEAGATDTAELDTPNQATPDETADAAPAAEATQDSPTVLLSDATGVRVLQPGQGGDVAPEVMSSVALDTITYSEAGDVALSGRSPGAGFVRIYLDNAPVTTSRIAPDGSWRSDLPEVDTGIYTLRVDQVSEAGTVVSRVETPFKREDTETLAAANRAEDAPVRAITVQPGNTLWAIARDRYGEGTAFVRVFEANRDRIRNPDLIYPGQVFDLPAE